MCVFVTELLRGRLTNSLHSFTNFFPWHRYYILSIFHDLGSKVKVMMEVKVIKKLKSARNLPKRVDNWKSQSQNFQLNFVELIKKFSPITRKLIIYVSQLHIINYHVRVFYTSCTIVAIKWIRNIVYVIYTLIVQVTLCVCLSICLSVCVSAYSSKTVRPRYSK